LWKGTSGRISAQLSPFADPSFRWLPPPSLARLGAGCKENVTLFGAGPAGVGHELSFARSSAAIVGESAFASRETHLTIRRMEA